jgi:hypothetical protein
MQFAAPPEQRPPLRLHERSFAAMFNGSMLVMPSLTSDIHIRIFFFITVPRIHNPINTNRQTLQHIQIRIEAGQILNS